MTPDVEDHDSLAEKGGSSSSSTAKASSTTLPKSSAKLPSYIEPSNEKLVTHGSARPVSTKHIHEDFTSEEGSQEEPVRGTVTPLKASFLLGKAFVGTGVLFLPKAFMNGGKSHDIEKVGRIEAQPQKKVEALPQSFSLI